MKAVDDTNKEPDIDWGLLQPDVKTKPKIGDKVGRSGVFLGSRGIYDEKNKLNNLTGKEWVIFTKSWFIHNPAPRKKNEMLHPAKFPESLIEDFIKFFTVKGDTVLDPMLGTGSTLVACDSCKRVGIGIELSEKWAKIAKNRTAQKIIIGDARKLESILEKNEVKKINFCITSPPYWDMLKKSRGGVVSAAKERKQKGLAESYSDDPNDLGNIHDYEQYLDELYKIYEQVYNVLEDKKYLVVICQNILDPNGVMIPFAWDLAKKIGKLFRLKQERIWLQDNKMLGSWGYPFTYVSNVHHHYCLIFEKIKTQP